MYFQHCYLFFDAIIGSGWPKKYKLQCYNLYIILKLASASETLYTKIKNYKDYEKIESFSLIKIFPNLWSEFKKMSLFIILLFKAGYILNHAVPVVRNIWT